MALEFLPNSMSSITDSYNEHRIQRSAWDARYRLKGRQWGNAPISSFNYEDEGIILELGIGDGKNVRCRSGSDAFVIGLDYSCEAIRLCQNDMSLHQVALLVGDACFLPFRDNVATCIFAHHILGHLPLLLEWVLLDEVYRVLSPGGMVFLTVFAQGDMRDNSGTEVEPSTYLRGDGIITRYYSEDMIRSLSRRFLPGEIQRIEWPLKIKGKTYVRREFAVLLKKGSDS